MAEEKRKMEKQPHISKFMRSYQILEYLRWHTDREHPTTQTKLREVEELRQYIGSRETFRDTIQSMVEAMNAAEHGYKAKDECPLHHKAFDRMLADIYGDELECAEETADDEDDELPWKDLRISDLYYQHVFSYDEINRLIEGVLFSSTLNSEDAKVLFGKIEKHLTTKFYPRGMKQICKVIEPQLTGQEQIQQNLLTIQRAIDERVQVRFQFNTYDRNKQLVPLQRGKDTVSPYYIVANTGRYYLIACKEIVRDDNPLRNMSIWRIDLMTEIEIPGEKPGQGEKKLPALNMREVENLPAQWDEEFHHSHLNMSFDRPVSILLRITPAAVPVQGAEKVTNNYTFLHDWFGDHFQYVRTEKEPPFADIVRVNCSPYAMANWAMQYSGRVEVLEPQSVRESIIEKIQALNQKYCVESGETEQVEK